MRATNETRKPTATPNGKTAGKPATKNTATRIDLWNKLAEERISRLADNLTPTPCGRARGPFSRVWRDCAEYAAPPEAS